MENKGLATIWTVLLTALLTLAAASGGYVLYSQQYQAEERDATSALDASPPSTFQTSQSSTGQNEEPFRSIGKLPFPINAVLYAGYVIVGGKYSLEKPYQLTFGPDENTYGGQARLVFVIDSQYKSKMPQAFGAPVGRFFLEPTYEAATALIGSDTSLFNDKSICNLSGQATIAISYLNVLQAEIGGLHQATLAKVISTSKPTVEKCP